MGFYDDMQGVAADLLAEFKQGLITLTRTPLADPDEDSPWQPGEAGEPTVYTLDATVKGVSAEFVDGSTILSTDLQVMAAVPPVVPAMTDVLAIDGSDVVLIRIDTIPAAGTPVAYRFIVRA